jgi:hypothetical protein
VGVQVNGDQLRRRKGVFIGARVERRPPGRQQDAATAWPESSVTLMAARALASPIADLQPLPSPATYLPLTEADGAS